MVAKAVLFCLRAEMSLLRLNGRAVVSAPKCNLPILIVSLFADNNCVVER